MNNYYFVATYDGIHDPSDINFITDNVFDLSKVLVGEHITIYPKDDFRYYHQMDVSTSMLPQEIEQVGKSFKDDSLVESLKEIFKEELQRQEKVIKEEEKEKAEKRRKKDLEMLAELKAKYEV